MEPRQVSKLYSEVSVLRELDHPHIVRMRQVFYSKVGGLVITVCPQNMRHLYLLQLVRAQRITHGRLVVQCCEPDLFERLKEGGYFCIFCEYP